MKTKLLVIAATTVAITLQVHAQGYIVPNGVVYAGHTGLGYEIDVVRDPTNYTYTGFGLIPTGKTQPTVYTNTFLFNPIVDIGVRVFLVSSNDSISLQPILANSYTELNGYHVFASGSPFYVGLYTGNDRFAPLNGIYEDPLFGWAKLVNNQGVIQMLDSALVYQAQGIFAGTQNFVPEPSVFALAALGALLLGFRRAQNGRR